MIYFNLGYGNLTPTLDEGKIFTIIVAFIGIPINIIFLAKIGEIFKKLSTFLLKPVKKISKDKQIFIITQVILIRFFFILFYQIYFKDVFF